MNTSLIRCVFTLLLALCSWPAFAVNYTFPGNLPAGCSGSGSSYTCAGGGGLGYNDTVAILSATPVTITVTGSMSTNNARINATGSASNLTIIVQGTLTAEFQAVLNANVTVQSLNGSGSEVVFGGNVVSTGAITLGYRTRVAGNISGVSITTGSEIDFDGNVTTTSGVMNIGGNSTVAGNLTSNAGAITLQSGVVVSGAASCTCAVTLNSQSRVNGNITAATFTSTSQAYMMGNITTTGAVDVAYGGTMGGSITADGSIRLRGNTPVPQCVRSTTSQAITLDWQDRANGGVCCGALGSCTTSCVANNSGAAMPAVCSGGSTTPARFNAFETSTASGSITGVIRTKVSGTAFNVAIVAVNSAGNGVATTFTGTVRVEVLDASNNAGALNATTNCRSTWSTASGVSSSTLTFTSGDAGRKNISLTVPDAFRDVRIRVISPDTGTATATGCSTDNFAVRPDRFALPSGATSWGSDATDSTTGTTRQLDNTALTGGRVHKAGQPFTVRAIAVSSTSATTANYTGTPTATLSACVAAACSSTLGALTVTPTATAGVINTSASYSEAGAFNLDLSDSSFASVDASDGSTAVERTITSAAIAIGRFVPNHFDVVNLDTPVLRTFNSSSCTSRSFTYLGQPFGYATRPRATVLARNAANATTTNYPSAKMSALTLTQTYGIGASAPGLDTTATTAPGLTASGSGVGVIAANNTDLLTMTRPASTPTANFNTSTAGYGISLAWSVTDTSEAAVTGNSNITTLTATNATALSYSPITFDMGDEFRYGQLKLNSAYGSELLALAVPVETQHWNGTSFVTNAADNCTTLPTSSLSLASFRGNLAACETAPTASSLSFASGRAVMRLQAPGNTNTGSVDGTLQLGNTITAGALRCASVGASTSAAVAANLPWLQSRAPGGTTYNQNPSARFSFGQRKAPMIQLREMY
ncbi:MAG: polymer-forming cytoskeletal protein [Rhizobacter sp.]